MIRFIPPGAVRQAFAYACAVLVMLVLLAGWLWSITAGRTDSQLTQLIASESNALVVLAREAGRDAAAAEIGAHLSDPTRANQVVLLADASFAPIVGNLSAWPKTIGTAPGWATMSIIREPGPSEARVVHRVLSDGSHLLYGYDLTDYFAGRKSFVLAFMGISIPLVVTVLLLGFFIRRSLLGQVGAINAAAGAIISGNLKERVPEAGDDTELHILSTTINRMLDHIETLVGGITNVSNTIAHDLRTPLAVARARFESLLATVPSGEPAYVGIRAGIADIDKLIRTFNALLRLAQIEAGSRLSGFQEVELPDIVTETVEFYQFAAEEKDIALTARIPPRLPLQGDPSLVAQALANLIDNAIKYTPAGGRIDVTVSQQASGAVIAVNDNGPGIPEGEKTRVVSRFYRSGRGKTDVGSGLGLSLVSAIATLHRGDLTLSDNHPGLRAVLGLQTHAGPAHMEPISRESAR